MSKENVETVRLFVEQWNAGRRILGDMAELVDPAFELESPLGFGEPYRGSAGIEQWARDIDEQFSEWQITSEDIREVGNQIISLGSIRGLGRTSGVVVQFRAGAVFTFGSDSRLVRLRLYPDADEALKAVGLEE